MAGPSGKVRSIEEPITDLAELAAALGIRKQSVAKRAKRQHWPYQEVPHPGHPLRLYSLSNLPDDIRRAVTAWRARHQPAPASPYREDKVIPERARQTGLARYRLHADWRRFRRSYKGRAADANQAFLLAYNSGQSHPSIYKILGRVSRSALYAWNKKLREHGDDYRVLCDHRGWAQAEGVQGKIGPEAESVFLKIWLTPQRPSVALAYRAMCAVLTQRGLPVPSLRSTYRFVSRYQAQNHDIVVLMRDGEKALEDRVGPYITRDDGQLEVGDVLFADGHRLNFDAIHPVTGRPARMTLILWMDWASRMPVGWEVMPEENTIAISSALYMAIKNLGKKPKVVYIDNGKAFRGRYFTHLVEDELPAQLTGLYHRLGIAVQFSRPYKARTKLVERFFGTFDAQCARLLPSHRGSSVADKPAYLGRNERFHRARHNTFIPTIPQVVDMFREYVGWYGMQEHDGLKGRRPLEVFAAGRGPGIPTKELTRDFLWRKQVKPRRCRVRIAGVDYESDALYGLNQHILAMFAWADMSEIHLYTLRGDYLGVARPVEALHPVARHLGDEIDLIKVQEANKRQARLKARTLRLAREAGASDEVISVLPWMNPERVPLSTPAPQLAADPGGTPRPPRPPRSPRLSDEDRLAIEEAQRRWEERQAHEPPYERPEFASPLDRYSYLFELREFEGVELLPEDEEFMRRYEGSPEWAVVRRRFEQLRRLSAAQMEQADHG